MMTGFGIGLGGVLFQVLARQPGAMQLRYLQTLGAIAGDKSSIIVFPLPLDVLAGVVARGRPPPE